MNQENTAQTRQSAGRKTGWIGLWGNLLLVLLKLAAGYLSNSVAVMADGLNNLTDCASSLVTLAGFTLSSKGDDGLHPYGHGRMEYVCGFMVSNLIILTALTAGKDALVRLINPQEIHVSNAVIFTLAAGVLAKLWMAHHVNVLNKSLSSPALRAVRNDDLSDSLVTSVALAGILLSPFTSLPLDGMLGIAVALTILRSGLCSFAENLLLLLGEGIRPETERQIRRIISEYSLFEEVKAIALHDYGPEKKLVFISVTRRWPAGPQESARTLELVKQRLRDELQLEATLYWDTDADRAFSFVNWETLRFNYGIRKIKPTEI